MLPNAGPPGMALPPPDLADAYAQLPPTWQRGAVLLADRILAAAYAQDVRETAARVRAAIAVDVDQSPTELLEELTAGHPRVMDRRRALQVLCYSPSVDLPLPPSELLALPERARQLFRRDVARALALPDADAAGTAPPEAPAVSPVDPPGAVSDDDDGSSPSDDDDPAPEPPAARAR